MKPIKAEDLIELDKNLEVVTLQCYSIPEQIVYQAAKCDYSETPIHNQKIPLPSECGKWIVDQLLSNDRGHYGCYSSDTEVLTNSGWVYWSDVNSDTVLAAYDTTTGVVNFEKPSAIQSWDYDDKMYHLVGEDLDFLVSPDHRMIVQSRKKDGSWSSSYVITAEEVFNKPVRYITSGSLSLSERIQINTPIVNPLFWALIGFWVRNGDNCESTNTLRFYLKEERKIQYLENICSELGLGFYPNSNEIYVVSYPEIGSWMNKNCLSDNLTSQKKLPEECFKLNTECIINLLDGLKNSDDSIGRRTWSYSTTSQILVDQLQSLASVNGMQFICCVPERDGAEYVLRLTDSVYSLVECDQHNHSTSYSEEWCNYSGKIHCATVSTGALIVRRNYKVAICGNCLEHPQITFSVSGYVHNVMVQGRTHRIGTSWDCQSQRYTGKRILKVANGELNPEDVFYVRPAGFYTNRKGKKYDWTEEHRQRKLERIVEECREYSEYYVQGVCEEHIRDYLPQAIRQNFVVSFNLRSILHFIDLRAKMDAQLEIQALCHSFALELKKWSPNVWAYYEEKRFKRAKLSP